MNKKAALLLADGFEEIEALATADILVRAGFTCDLISTTGDEAVKSTHGVTVVADRLLSDFASSAIANSNGSTHASDPSGPTPVTTTIPPNPELSYDLLILPGGQPGADNLRANPEVISKIKTFAETPGKYLAAICAAPEVLAKADVVRGKRVTSYPADAFRTALEAAGAAYLEEKVVVDGNLITSRGPGTTFDFAFTLVDLLGGNSDVLKEAMLLR